MIQVSFMTRYSALLLLSSLAFSAPEPAAVPSAATFMPKDAGVIMFGSKPDSSQPFGVYRINPDGSNRKQLIRPKQGNRGGYHPFLSPDGKKISFTTYRYGGWKVAICDADGSNIQRVTTDPHYAYRGNWAVDGSHLLISRVQTAGPPYFRGNRDIFRIDLDTLNATNLTNGGGRDDHPSYRPDGKRILFSTTVNGVYELMTMNPDGGKRTNLTKTDSFHEWAPSWSPNGKQIAFQGVVEDSAQQGYQDVFVMNADGSGIRNLTQHRKRGLKEDYSNNESVWIFDTSWSPDGSMIAFVSNMEGAYQIYVVTLDGKKLGRVTQGNVRNFNPQWLKKDAL